MGRRTRRAPEPIGRTHLERAERWAGLRAGDPVEVADTRLHRASWTFLAHVRNTGNGEEWVEVVGGRTGERTVRSFRPEQVYAPRSKHTAAERLSLADAPQLPFD